MSARTLTVHLSADKHLAARTLETLAILLRCEGESVRSFDLKGPRGIIGRAEWSEDLHWTDAVSKASGR